MNDQQPGNGAQTQRNESPSPEGQKVTRISILPPTESAMVDWMNDRIRYFLSIRTSSMVEWGTEEWLNHGRERRALIAWLNHSGSSYSEVRNYFLNKEFEGFEITEDSPLIEFLDKITVRDWATVNTSNIDKV